MKEGNNMLLLAKRNIKLYFRDRPSVFFSLLAVFITLGLYIFFLGDMQARGLEREGVENATLFMHTFTMSGILAVTAFTTTLAALGTMIEDKRFKIDKDFLASPLTNTQITGGYILSGYIVGILMTFIVFIVTQVYLLSLGATMLSVDKIISILGIVLLSNAMNTALLMFLLSFIKTMSAYSGFSTVVGTLIGFLTGIYIPIGGLPTIIQTIIKCFPVSQTAALYRQILMDDLLQGAALQLPEAYIHGLKEDFGIIFQFQDTVLTQGMHIAIIVGFLIVFYIGTMLCFKYLKKH